MWHAQVIVMTEFGNFSGRKLIVDDEKFKTLCDLSKEFYGSGFELTLEDGSFVVIAPQIVSRSILKIEKHKIEEDVEE